jgi:hypothetical protein
LSGKATENIPQIKPPERVVVKLEEEAVEHRRLPAIAMGGLFLMFD